MNGTGGTDSNQAEIYFGYAASAGEDISKIVLTFTNDRTINSWDAIGLDDLGFTQVIPEPVSGLLLLFGGPLAFRAKLQ